MAYGCRDALIKFFIERNRENVHKLRGVFAVMDGGRMPFAGYSDPSLQNAYWEGLTQVDEVTNHFVWNFHGEVVFAANYPWRWHNYKLVAASGLYSPILTENTPAGFVVLGEKAFSCSERALVGKVVRARKANELGRSSDVPISAWITTVDTLLESSMPSERQSTEWGDWAIKWPFKRLTVPLHADSHSRYWIIVCCTHLYNFIIIFVDLNHIRNTF